MAKAKPKPPELRDFGTPEIKQRHLVVIEGHKLHPHARVVDQRPLDRYFVRHLLSPKDPDMNRLMYLAGCRLREDWELAGLVQKLTGNLDGVDGGKREWSETQLDAKARKDRALKEIGLIFTPLIVHVVCTDGSAGEWGQRHCGSRRKGLPALRIGLWRLVKHYRL